MIEVIMGKKGSGKTKKLLAHANKTVKEASGSVVFIDDDNSYMFDLRSGIRFVNASDYGITTPKMLYGFINGIAAMDFDLQYVYVDAFLKLVSNHDPESLTALFEALEKLSISRGIRFIISISADNVKLPEFVKPLGEVF